MLFKPTPIRNIDQQFTRTKKAMVITMVLVSPGLYINPGDALILGYLVGGVFGLLNIFFLARRINTLSQLIIDKGASYRQAVFFMQAGFYPRMGMIIGICALASQIDFLNVYGVGVGILLPTLITTVDANLALYRYYTARDAVDKI